MKLRHLFESDDVFKKTLDQSIAKIKTDCGPWLAETKSELVYRGIRLMPDPFVRELDQEDILSIGHVRNDRKPADSPAWLHRLLNEYFVSKVGLPLRSTSLFVTNDKDVTEHYGTTHAIFPIGKFNYAWSRFVDDPTERFYSNWGDNSVFEWKQELIDLANKYCSKNKLKYPDVEFFIEYSTQKEWAKFVKDFVTDNQLWSFNTGIKIFLNDIQYMSHEMMINCDKYYAVNIEVLSENNIDLEHYFIQQIFK